MSGIEGPPVVFLVGEESIGPRELGERHRTIAHNVSVVLEELVRTDDVSRSEAAIQAKRLLIEGRAVLWPVERKLDCVTAAAHIFPDSEGTSLMPAIVVNGLVEELLETPSSWGDTTRSAVEEAIINLPALYRVALSSSYCRLLSREQFLERLEASPGRPEIVLVWKFL